MNKEEKIEYLREAVRKVYPDRKLVFQDGSPDARIMVIGEAPGKDEETQGIPFIGRAGKLFTTTIEALGWKRSDFFISNIVKYRPQDELGSTLTPTDAEIGTFRPIIEKEIEVVEPHGIVVLGRVAMTGLGIAGTMAQNHGKILDFKNRKVLIVYHPAAILRNMTLEPLFRADLARMREL